MGSYKCERINIPLPHKIAWLHVEQKVNSRRLLIESMHSIVNP